MVAAAFEWKQGWQPIVENPQPGMALLALLCPKADLQQSIGGAETSNIDMANALL